MHSLPHSAPASRVGVPRWRMRRALAVQAAKKGPSPWSSGGPKRGNGKGGEGGSSSSGGSNGGSNGANGGGGGGKAGGRSSPSSPWSDARPKQQPKPAPKLSARVGARLAAPAPEVTITDPVEVTLLDALGKVESSPDPMWATFCSLLGGEWVGQYAAYTPWEGKPEPAWMDERGKYIHVVYTRALEHRYKHDGSGGSGGAGAVGGAGSTAPAAAGADARGRDSGDGGEAVDVLLRRMARCTTMAALPGLAIAPDPAAAADGAGSDAGEGDGGEEGGAGGGGGGEGADVDVEALEFNANGVVVFDGGNYSAGPEFIGQQAVKLVRDEELLDLDAEVGAAAAAAAAAERAASGAAASTSARGSSSGSGSGKGQEEAQRAAAARDEGRGASGDDSGEDEYADEGEGEDGSTVLPTSTSVFEQCLVDWGTKTRVRAKLTLRIGQLEDGEVDVEVLRILLFREQWVGPGDNERLAAQLPTIRSLATPCTNLPRPTPEQLQGSWNVFAVSATCIDEEDPFTGEERSVWVYSSLEEQQLWDARSKPPTGDAGGSYWLPGGLLLSLRMVDNYGPDGEEDGEEDGSGSGDSDHDAGGGGRGSANGNGHGNGNGNGNGNGYGSGLGVEGERSCPRGLCVSLAWQWREGSVSVVEREYDGYGYLREVRLAQGVKGGWAGGRM